MQSHHIQEFQKKLLHHIKMHSDGISLRELLQIFKKDIAKRSLQRLLKICVENASLIVVGKGPATKYKINFENQNNAEIEESKLQNTASDISLSIKSKELTKLIHQPIQKRKPVGYNRNFLDNYKPNESEYLSKSLRLKLKKIGLSTNDNRVAGTYATQILERLLIDLSWNSSRLEGNTYSLLDTQRLIQFGETAEGKAAFESQMILNHKEAIEFLIHNAGQIEFNRYTLLNLHALLSNNLLINPVASGQLRKIPVAIGQAAFEPLSIPQLIEECFQQVLDTATAIKDPFEQAFFIMVHLPYLQPFEDVNKRVSRLAANIPFIKHNLCPLSFIDVPERVYIDGIIGVYEFNRIEVLRDLFVWSYERSCQRYLAVRQTLGEPDPFRMKYRLQMIQLINEIINKKLNKKEGMTHLKNWSSEHLPKMDNARFERVIIEELSSLHEGNIARFRIQLKAFQGWYKVWAAVR